MFLKKNYAAKNSFKYKYNCDNNDNIMSLCIRLSQMRGCENTLIVIKQCLLRLLIKIY